MNIVERLVSYNDRLAKRDLRTIDCIVLHCTELPTLEMARDFSEKIVNEQERTGNCGHYYIDRDGTVYRYVQDVRIAHHVLGFNQSSLGIEIVNEGRYPHWFWSTHQQPTEKYTHTQMKALTELLQDLTERYPGVSRLARHSDLDTRMIAAEDNPSLQVRRRIDPGPMFPWEVILKSFEALQRF